MNDIVYILRNNINDEELIYSIRSVVQNFPYNNIWFAGGTPQHLTPDFLLPWTQQGQNKWFKVRNTLKILCNEPKLSDDFWLFNDDFFVMKPISCPEEVPVIDGTLKYLFQRRTANDKAVKEYAKQLLLTEKNLIDKKMDTLNYCIHVPILLNKEKILQTLITFPNTPLFRALYGNQHHIKGLDTNDIKITNTNKTPTGKEIFLSTDDKSFNYGLVGRYIKQQFTKKTQYEK